MSQYEIEIYTLGRTALVVDGQIVTGIRKKALLLLIYMVLISGEHSRERLASLYWPELDRSDALGRLRRCLFDLNKISSLPVLESTRNTVQVDVKHIGLDVLIFNEHIHRCYTHGHSKTQVCSACIPELIQAIALYRGDFLADVSVSDSVELDNWHLVQSEHLRTNYLIALEHAAIYHASHGDFSQALPLVQELINLDPLRASSRYLIMLIYAGMDQMQAAIAQYEAYKELLDEVLAILPEPDIRNLYYRLVQREDYQDFIDYKDRVVYEKDGEVESRKDSLPLDTEILSSGTSSLPHLEDGVSFLGREQEMDQLLAQLAQPTCRLLTISGLGGVGKRRMAIEVIYRVKDSFNEGAYFLQYIKSGELPLSHQIAQAVGFSFYSSKDQNEQLINYLRNKSMFIVINGFSNRENELELLNILLNETRTKIMVTSISPLGLAQEHILILEGLKRINEDENPGRELFLQVARRNNLGVVIYPEDYQCIDEIVELVAGVPLAIRLAASWTTIMSCDDIAAAIKEDVRFLNDGSGDMLHNQTLEDIFDYSWRLLSPQEQEAIAALSICRGTFTLGAGRVIADATILQIVSLINKSFITREEDQRFQVHTLLQQFLRRKLEENQAFLAEVQKRLIQYYSDFAMTINERRVGPYVGSAIHQLSAEMPSIIYVWELAVQYQQVDALNQLVDSIYYYHRLYSLDKSGNTLLERAISEIEKMLCLGEYPPNQIRLFLAKAWVKQSWFLANLGDHPRASTVAEQSYQIALDLEDPVIIPEALVQLAYLQLTRGNHDIARDLIQQAIAIYQDTGELEGLSKATTSLGIVLRRQDKVDEAHESARLSLNYARQLEDPLLQSYAYNTLGLILLQQNRYEEAGQLFQRSQSLREPIVPDSRWLNACSNMNLGLVAKHQGDLNISRNHLNRASQLFRDIGHPSMFITCTEELGEVLMQLDYLNQAGKLLSECLHKAWDVGNDEVALRVMARITRLRYQQEEFLKAQELATTVLQHPFCNDKIRALIPEALRN